MHLSLPGFEYFERPATGALLPLVAQFRAIRASAACVAQRPVMRTLPDGCSELVFVTSGEILDIPATGPTALKPRAFYMGPLEQVRMAEARGHLEAISVFFRPGALNTLNAGEPVEAYVERVVPAEAILDPDDSFLLERALSTNGLAAKVDFLEQYVLRWALRRRTEPDRVLAAAVSVLEAQRGESRIEDLAQTLGYSRRQLERRFLKSIGLTPKALARTIRFKHSLYALCDTLGAQPQAHFLDGFYDQSHLTKEFRKFSGMTPTTLTEEVLQSLIVRGLEPTLASLRKAP
jgi:AraC-like DNA-binding protein